MYPEVIHIYVCQNNASSPLLHGNIFLVIALIALIVVIVVKKIDSTTISNLKLN